MCNRFIFTALVPHTSYIFCVSILIHMFFNLPYITRNLEECALSKQVAIILELKQIVRVWCQQLEIRRQCRTHVSACVAESARQLKAIKMSSTPVWVPGGDHPASRTHVCEAKHTHSGWMAKICKKNFSVRRNHWNNCSERGRLQRSP